VNFFNIGPMELIVILTVALFVFGPQKLPGIARDLGRTVREFQAAAQTITNQVVTEIEAEASPPTPTQLSEAAAADVDAAPQE